MPAAERHAIFLSGPIGVGKTTLGRALAEALDAGFIDGDDHADQNKPWYCSSLSTSLGVVRAGLAALEERQAVIVAYPLRRVNWIYYHRRFAAAQVQSLFIGLDAPLEAILAENRGRRFDAEESERIAEMIAQGYGGRPFYDAVVGTGGESFAGTLEKLTAEVRRLMPPHVTKI